MVIYTIGTNRILSQVLTSSPEYLLQEENVRSVMQIYRLIRVYQSIRKQQTNIQRFKRFLSVQCGTFLCRVRRYIVYFI
jgi:hypothetical protein